MIDREVKIMMSINHPTFVKIFGYSKRDFLDENNITIIMDYISNGSLTNIFTNIQKNDGPHEYNNTIRQIIITGVSRALKYLHDRNIIHRDVKPDNILLDDEFHPHLTDFGLSKFSDNGHSFSQSFYGGTLCYMAPEIIKNETYGKKVDVYSFAILMYETITDLKPYPKVENGEISDYEFRIKVVNENYRPEFKFPIKKSFKELIESCWSDDPKERPTFGEIFEKLSSCNEEFLLDDVDIDEFRVYVEDIIEANDPIEKVLHKNTSLKEENQMLKDEISKMKSKSLKIQKENQKLKLDYEKVQKENKKLKSEISQLKSDNEKVQKENKKLKSEISQLKSDNEDVNTQKNKLTNQKTKIFKKARFTGDNKNDSDDDDDHIISPDSDDGNDNDDDYNDMNQTRSSVDYVYIQKTKSVNCKKSRFTDEELKNQKIWLETERIVKDGHYLDTFKGYNDIKKKVDDSIKNTYTIHKDANYDCEFADKFKNKRFWGQKEKKEIYSKIEVTYDSTVGAAKKLKDEGIKEVCLLNARSAINPGGNVKKGKKGQEEMILLQSSLYFSLIQQTEMYDYHKIHTSPFYTHYMIYSPNVVFLRDDFYNLIPHYRVSVITSTPANYTELSQLYSYGSRDKDILACMKNRCRKILQVAIKNNNKAIVLNDFGCSEYGNNPKSISKIFKELLVDEFYGMFFKKICFALNGTPNKHNPIIVSFKEMFKYK